MKVEVHKFGTLAQAQAQAGQRVDEAAEAARTKYITPGSGQAMEYTAAAQEATRFLADPIGAFPMLQADVDAGLSVDLPAAATSVLTAHAQWEALGAGIRTLRLSAKQQIRLATTQAQVAQIREQAIATLASL